MFSQKMKAREDQPAAADDHKVLTVGTLANGAHDHNNYRRNNQDVGDLVKNPVHSDSQRSQR